MTVTFREAGPEEVESLVPLLRLAEPSEAALRWSLAHLSDTVHRLDEGKRPVAAATVRWGSDPAELVELAVAPERRGQGLGRELVRRLVEEAKGRGARTLMVGTPNASIGNIVFYQKCGFRMDHVRHDYFWYYSRPRVEHGIRVRDMLVFRYDVADGTGRRAGERRARPATVRVWRRQGGRPNPAEAHPSTGGASRLYFPAPATGRPGGIV